MGVVCYPQACIRREAGRLLHTALFQGVWRESLLQAIDEATPSAQVIRLELVDLLQHGGQSAITVLLEALVLIQLLLDANAREDALVLKLGRRIIVICLECG